MAGTPAGAARSRAIREAKMKAAGVARRAAYDAEIVAQAASVTCTDAPTALMENPDPKKHDVVENLIQEAAPLAAVTMTRALTHRGASWQVRVQAAEKILAMNGFGDGAPIAGARGGVLDMAPSQLGEFVGSVIAELERRRQDPSGGRQEHVINGEVIPPDQGQQTDK